MLEVVVNNIEIDKSLNATFFLNGKKSKKDICSLFFTKFNANKKDPHHNFGLSDKPARCETETRTCRQTIHIKSRSIKHNQYVMSVEFKSRSRLRQRRAGVGRQMTTISSLPSSLTAPIHVVIRPSKQVKQAPRFVNTPSELFLFRSTRTSGGSGQNGGEEGRRRDQVVISRRNASVFVVEDESASLLNSGFHLDILNPDMTPMDAAGSDESPFEIVPNYGHGFLPSILRIKTNFARRTLSSGALLSNQKYDLIVCF